MNVTSVLSGGYLRPSIRSTESTESTWERLSASAAVEETERVGDGSSNSSRSSSEDATGKDDAANAALLRELKRVEQEVIAHEAAHRSAGGSLTGAATYTYTSGPDGRQYISGGEVPISVPASDDPEQTLRDMERVRAAALAPANPSSQDIGVAAQASAAAAQARQQIARHAASESDDESRGENDGETPKSGTEGLKGVDALKTELRREQLLSEQPKGAFSAGSSPFPEGALSSTEIFRPEDAYAQTASKRGLWTFATGFEPGTSRLFPDIGLDIAA